MDSETFREFGKAVIDYIADYMDNIRDKPVLSTVKPGYLYDLVPPEAPAQGEDWRKVMTDVENIIMPGITHWNSPQFHAYYPAANSYPAVIGDLLSNGLGCLGISWASSPACTELEVQVMNWLGKMLNLPKEFLNESEGPGGGILQGSASECTLLCLLAAKERTTKRINKLCPYMSKREIKSKLVVYSSDQSNSSVEKASLMGSVSIRLLKVDQDGQLTGAILAKAIAKDIGKGLIPCYVVATLGTTSTCAYDRLEELGRICSSNNIWLHVDAAYAGAAFVLPEYRHLMAGIQYADSFIVNLHKLFLVNNNCTAMWLKNASHLSDAFRVDRAYLESNYQRENTQLPDYRHWQISIGRRFRSLKTWFVLRLYGVEGVRAHVKKHASLAKLFGELVSGDSRFEIITPVSLGLVCFRLKGDNIKTKILHENLTRRGIIYLITTMFCEKLVIRFVVCSSLIEEKDVHFAWNEIQSQVDSDNAPIE